MTKCKMCFSEIDETKKNDQWGNFKCNCRVGWPSGPCYTYYHEIVRIMTRLRSKIIELDDASKYSDNFHRKVGDLMPSLHELSQNVLKAARNGITEETNGTED